GRGAAPPAPDRFGTTRRRADRERAGRRSASGVRPETSSRVESEHVTFGGSVERHAAAGKASAAKRGKHEVLPDASCAGCEHAPSAKELQARLRNDCRGGFAARGMTFALFLEFPIWLSVSGRTHRQGTSHAAAAAAGDGEAGGNAVQHRES